MQESYEERISQLQGLAIPNNVRSSNTGTEVATEDVQYDVFVSHAWEDKESFADEFVKELNKLNLRVWYDTSQIKWGDSMRAKFSMRQFLGHAAENILRTHAPAHKDYLLIVVIHGTHAIGQGVHRLNGNGGAVNQGFQ